MTLVAHHTPEVDRALESLGRLETVRITAIISSEISVPSDCIKDPELNQIRAEKARILALAIPHSYSLKEEY